MSESEMANLLCGDTTMGIGDDFLMIKFTVLGKVDCCQTVFKLLDDILQRFANEIAGRSKTSKWSKSFKKCSQVLRYRQKSTISYWISDKHFLKKLFLQAGISGQSLLKFTSKKGHKFEVIVDSGHRCLLRFSESSVSPASYLKLKLFANRVG